MKKDETIENRMSVFSPSRLTFDVEENLKAIEKGEEDCLDVIITAHRDYSVKHVEELLESMGVPREKIRTVEQYVSAILTADQVKRLAKEESVFRIWLNRQVKLMLDASLDAIKARPAWRVFGICGEGITWAILDSGIDAKHPALKNKVIDQYNFTRSGKDDRTGHGTHVAGIIASDDKRYRGIAPGVKLYDFKVVNDDGSGDELSLIQAIAKIKELNGQRKVIHGVNISLGFPFDVRSYACGASPICDAVNSLVHSGVVVCAAASNDGFKKILTLNESNQQEAFSTYLALGITDPGNASQAITVGSTHKAHPHHFGVSYFSSRGPTGDGRLKPDLLAPGERIISCRASGTRMGKPVDELYTEASGTSMAAPHVSGAAALLLSLRKELIGRPEEVKRILLSTCTDLERDRYHQGHGLLDILRAMQTC